MKKILNNKDLLQQFISDKSTLTQKELVQKYDISQATVSCLLKQFNSQNNSLNEQSISEQSEQEEQSQSEQNDQEQSIKSEEQQIQNNEYIQVYACGQVQESFIEHHNNSLIEYLNEEEKPQQQKQITEQKSYQQQRNYQKNNNYKKYQKDEQQQQIEQVQIAQESDQQIQNKMNNQMIKIRKLMQYFKNEYCKKHLIGANEGQQRQFSDNLYKKDLNQLSDIYVKLQFELMFSRSNNFMENTKETTAEFLEKLLLVANINVVNCFQEMKQDEEFQFHMKILICKSSYIPSSKQVIFMKFIKNYYQKYQQNKQSFNSEIKQNLDVKINQSQLNKFNSL